MDPFKPNSPPASVPGRATKSSPVPMAAVGRLSLYLRELQRLASQQQETVSSTSLGRLLGFTDAQVRRDLAHFGQFGYPGVGYRCDELIQVIRRILGTDRHWPVGIVGVGNVGRALLGYRGFLGQGFLFVAAFDVDAAKVGQKIEGVDVSHLDRLPQVAKSLQIQLGVIAVPAPAAQSVADRLVEAGIAGILNFAPVSVSVPRGVQTVAVDLAIAMEQLVFSVQNTGCNQKGGR